MDTWPSFLKNIKNWQSDYNGADEGLVKYNEDKIYLRTSS